MNEAGGNLVWCGATYEQ